MPMITTSIAIVGWLAAGGGGPGEGGREGEGGGGQGGGGRAGGGGRETVNSGVRSLISDRFCYSNIGF